MDKLRLRVGEHIEGVAPYTISSLEACPNEALWRARIEGMLQEAGVPAGSWVDSVSLMQPETGEPLLRFILRPGLRKVAAEKVLDPHKGQRIGRAGLAFTIPMSFFEGKL